MDWMSGGSGNSGVVDVGIGDVGVGWGEVGGGGGEGVVVEVVSNVVDFCLEEELVKGSVI